MGAVGAGGLGLLQEFDLPAEHGNLTATSMAFVPHPGGPGGGSAGVEADGAGRRGGGLSFCE